jgi:hypothetical protein
MQGNGGLWLRRIDFPVFENAVGVTYNVYISVSGGVPRLIGDRLSATEARTLNLLDYIAADELVTRFEIHFNEGGTVPPGFGIGAGAIITSYQTSGMSGYYYASPFGDLYRRALNEVWLDYSINGTPRESVYDRATVDIVWQGTPPGDPIPYIPTTPGNETVQIVDDPNPYGDLDIVEIPDDEAEDPPYGDLTITGEADGNSVLTVLALLLAGMGLAGIVCSLRPKRGKREFE